VKPLRIWLVGTGTVGTWLAGALGSQRERLATGYGLDAMVVGAASARGGFVYDANGLDLASLPAAARGSRPAAGGRGVGRWPATIEGCGPPRPTCWWRCRRARPPMESPG
jgi:hypothetical protein